MDEQADTTVYQRHLIDCTSNLSAMVYDSRCKRCGKIKHVIALRRKGLAGATIHEAASANAIAAKLQTLYRLTRGEVMDREYAVKAVQTRQDVARAATRRRRRNKFELDSDEVAI